jgi:hypothetical protein
MRRRGSHTPCRHTAGPSSTQEGSASGFPPFSLTSPPYSTISFCTYYCRFSSFLDHSGHFYSLLWNGNGMGVKISTWAYHLRRDGTIYVLPDDTIIKTWGRFKKGEKEEGKSGPAFATACSSIIACLTSWRCFFLCFFCLYHAKIKRMAGVSGPAL